MILKMTQIILTILESLLVQVAWSQSRFILGRFKTYQERPFCSRGETSISPNWILHTKAITCQNKAFVPLEVILQKEILIWSTQPTLSIWIHVMIFHKERADGNFIPLCYHHLHKASLSRRIPAFSKDRLKLHKRYWNRILNLKC